jgi:hypothetical protein
LTDRKTALLIVAVIVALSLVAATIHFYDKPLFNKDALFKKNISLKKKCPSPKPSITIEPYRIPLPVMIASEKSVGKKW